MYHPTSRWTQRHGDMNVSEERVTEAANVLGIHPFIAEILIRRGIDDLEKMRRFLAKSPDMFHDPFLMDGMERAVDRIRRGIECDETICIFGDYDADGVTGTSLLIELFRLFNKDVHYYIPNRFTEGYGLNGDAITRLAKQGVTLIITVDTGISAIDEAKLAETLGVDLIITDHHEPPAQLPDALAVLNPKKPGCPYPDEELAGVGVAYKLAHALLGRHPYEFLSLATVGTIADLVPLTGENRALVSLGLEQINKREHIGITALLDICQLHETDVTVGHIGYMLGPRLNATGRIDVADPAVQLLTTRDEAEAVRLANQLDELNRTRQQLVEQLTKEAIALVEADPELHEYAIVLAGEGWNTGVLGIVASRLVERFYRPAVVIGIDPETGEAKGSARSIAGFHLYEALTKLEGLLRSFGGHQAAAGLTLCASNIDRFRQELSALVKHELFEEDFTPVTFFDMSCTVDEISVDWVEQLSLLAPFGIGNPTPCFRITGGRLRDARRIGKDGKHLRLAITSEQATIQAIGFRQGDISDHVTKNAIIEAVGELQINEWNGHRSPQLVVNDIRIAQIQLFDWRGFSKQRASWDSLIERKALFVCFDEHTKENNALIDRGIRFYQWQKDNLNAIDRTITDLVIVDYPTDKQSYYDLLRHFYRLERVYMLGETNEEQVFVPNREDFKRVYALLKYYGCCRLDVDVARWSQQTNISQSLILLILDVFIELGFATREKQEIIINQHAPKRSLEESVLFTQRKRRAAVYQQFFYASAEELLREIIEVRTEDKFNRSGGNDDEFQRHDSSDSRLSPAGSTL